ncbi:MAG: SHOCT domain-containing protein [Synergistales bacterium]|nr:SHOCT domain-containing protein [Synergistales bacterium]
MHFFGGNCWGMGWGGMLIGVVVVVGIVALAVSMFRKEPEKKPPLEVLKDRYARGDIDREEFEQRKRDLGY